MNFRTDLALEIRDKFGEHTPKGVKSSEQTYDNFKISHIDILDSDGEREMKKPMGRYITISSKELFSSIASSEEEILAIAKNIRNMLPDKTDKPVLVVGLGNRNITPDALGPKAVSRILATRHISKELAQSLKLYNLRSVAVLSPGVLGQTGVESCEIIASVVKRIDPCAVIVIDALASKSVKRLGTTIQISNSGIAPGSGVHNHRSIINKEVLGVPVVAIGVPTVVDASTLVFDFISDNTKKTESLQTEVASFMVTPKEIDLLIKRSAEFISLGINKALQPDLDLEDINMLVS